MIEYDQFRNVTRALYEHYVGLVGAQSELPRMAPDRLAVDEDLEAPGAQIEWNSLRRCTTHVQHDVARATTDAAHQHDASVIEVAPSGRRRRRSGNAEAQHGPDAATQGGVGPTRPDRIQTPHHRGRITPSATARL